MTEENNPNEYDPIDTTAQATSTSAIALLRIYDVLISMYEEQNPQDARELAALHAAGRLRSTLPFLDMENQ